MVETRRRNTSRDKQKISPLNTVKPPRKLLYFNELEDWRKDNEFILTGYVPSERSFRKCLHSLFYIHNETGNVYTHLIPSVFVFVIQAFAILEITPPLILFFAGCTACLGMSATYHLLGSHSHRVASIGNKFDYVGICILIATSMISLVEIAFNDKQNERHLFIGLTTIFAVLCSAVSLSDTFRTPKYRPVRATMFVLYGLSGVFPVLVGYFQFGYREVSLRSSCPWLYMEAFCYIFGAFLYALRFPEKHMPGKFDFIGHSHQIFHVFVVFGAYSHYMALRYAHAYAVIRNLSQF